MDATLFVDNCETRIALLQRRFPESRIYQTMNAYDPIVAIPEYTAAPKLRATFVGRLVEQKGIREVIELGRLLHQECPTAEIHVIGDGPEANSMHASIAHEGLSNICMHGFVDETTKWALLAESQLFIAPSHEEGWGIAVGEALLAGIPVIAYDLPAYSHFGDAVMRVPQRQRATFVDSARDLLYDTTLLEPLTIRAREARMRLPRWDDIVPFEVATILARRSRP
jgi:glycosyltransferase involved in cell wall biosynthesis